MRPNLKWLFFGSAAALGSVSSAYGQCSGQAASGYVCANPGASQGLPSFGAVSPLLDRVFGSTQGAILNRGVSGWNSTTSPVLGLNGTIGGFITLNGATSGAVVLGVPAAAGTTTFNLPATNGTSGFTLHTDGAGNTSWSTAGSGTVTNIGVTVATSILAVAPANITTTGTFAITLATQTANLVWAGPTTGVPATPTFRSLVGADLPNPSASSLGGIQSAAAVSHQWVSSISTTGIPALTQPAFTDISGTASAAQLPNPTASTLGGIESYLPVTHQWINTISTSGVPASSQPSFTDISGQATLAQLPSIGSNTVLGNNTGGTTTPTALSASQVLDTINNVQGDVLYRSGSAWSVLAPGTGGQVLTTGGASANPSWTTVTGTGTVTNVATGTGLTGGPITTTGTVSLASVTNNTVMSNISGGSAAPTANPMSSVLDSTLGSTEGNIIYRGASTWAVLAPGTSGQYLQTLGGGSTPQWATNTWNGQSGAVVSVVSAQGRLTFASHTPVMVASQTSQSTIYYDSYVGNQVPYYTGTADSVDTIASNEVSSVLQSSSTGVLNTNGVFDVWWEGNTHHNICVATNGSGGGWASDSSGSNTARGTVYSALDSTTRPYPTNSTTVTHCYNGATDYGPITANKLTYIASILTDAASTGLVSFTLGTVASGGGAGRIGLWNAWNRVPIKTTVNDTGGAAFSWTYNTANTFRAADAPGAGSGLNNRVTAVYGINQDVSEAAYSSLGTSAAATLAVAGVGLDTTTSFCGVTGLLGASLTSSGMSRCAIYAGAGVHFFQEVEAQNSTATVTWFGNNALYQSGMIYTGRY